MLLVSFSSVSSYGQSPARKLYLTKVVSFIYALLLAAFAHVFYVDLMKIKWRLTMRCGCCRRKPSGVLMVLLTPEIEDLSADIAEDEEGARGCADSRKPQAFARRKLQCLQQKH